MRVLITKLPKPRRYTLWPAAIESLTTSINFSTVARTAAFSRPVLRERFDNLCSVEIEFPLDAAPEIEGKLFSVEGSFIEELTVGMD